MLQDSYRMTSFGISGDVLFEIRFGRFSMLGTVWINLFRRKLIHGVCRSNGAFVFCYMEVTNKRCVRRFGLPLIYRYIDTFV
jgi:hypothetical protein